MLRATVQIIDLYHIFLLKIWAMCHDPHHAGGWMGLKASFQQSYPPFVWLQNVTASEPSSASASNTNGS
jgi:hypothetical protein